MAASKKIANKKTVAKVAKLDKGKGKAAASKQAATKPGKGKGKGKAAPASGQAAARARIANKTLRVTPEGKAHPGYRGARGECWQLVLDNNGKPASNVVGQPYTGRAGDAREFDSSFIAFFVGEGLVELAD